MTNDSLKALLRPLMPQILAAVEARVRTQQTATFAAESDDSPQFRPSFGRDDVARLSDYFADDEGAYPGTLHRHFGLGNREFADLSKLIKKQITDKNGNRVWHWVKREPPAQGDRKQGTGGNNTQTPASPPPASTPPQKDDGTRYDTDGASVAKEIAAELAPGDAGLRAKMEDLALTAAAHAYKLALEFTHSKWSQHLSDLLEAVFDTPADLGKLGYNPGNSSGVAQPGVLDSVKTLGVPGLNGHVAAKVAAAVVTKALFFLKDKLKATPKQMSAEGDWRDDVADALCDLFDAVNEACGLPPVEWDAVRAALDAAPEPRTFAAFDESKVKRDHGKFAKKEGSGDTKTKEEDEEDEELPEWDGTIKQDDVKRQRGSAEHVAEWNFVDDGENYEQNTYVETGEYDPFPDHPDSQPVEVYRWYSQDDTGHRSDEGEWVSDESDARSGARSHARRNHEETAEPEEEEVEDDIDEVEIPDVSPPEKRDVTLGTEKLPRSDAAVGIKSRVNEDLSDTIVHAVFGGKKGDYTALGHAVGMPDDAEVDVVAAGKYQPLFSDDLPIPGAVGVRLEVSHPKMDRVSRFAGIDGAGKRFIKNEIIEIKKQFQGEGMGEEIFTRQVEAASGEGIDYITTHAAGRFGGSMNGYYTWPTFGYDQRLDDPASHGPPFDKAKKLFPQAESVLDIMAVPSVELAPEEFAETKRKLDELDVKLKKAPKERTTITGADWWKVNGTDLHNAKFDLTPTSRSMAVLAARRKRTKAATTFSSPPIRRRWVMKSGRPSTKTASRLRRASKSFSDTATFAARATWQAGTSKDGKTQGWVSSGGQFRKTKPAGASAAPAEPKAAVAPAPATEAKPQPAAKAEPPPEAAKQKPDAGAVHEEVRGAFADPASLTPEKEAALIAKLKTLTVPQIQAIQKERGIKGGTAKAQRVQKLIEGAKATVAKGKPKEEPKGAASDPVSAAKAAATKHNDLLAKAKPLADKYNAMPDGRAKTALGKQLDALDGPLGEAKAETDKARAALADHNGHDYGVHVVDGPGAEPRLLARHNSLAAANAASKGRIRDKIFGGDSVIDHGRDIDNEYGEPDGTSHAKSGSGKEIYVGKVPRDKGSAGTGSVAQLDDAGFAKAVLDASVGVPRIGSKVWIHHAYDELKKRDPSLTETDFKRRLVDANMGRRLNLSTADLIQAFDKNDISRSATQQGGSTHHLIDTAPIANPRSSPAAAPANASPHPARAVLDAAGLAHGHLSDDEVSERLRRAFAPPEAAKSTPGANPKEQSVNTDTSKVDRAAKTVDDAIEAWGHDPKLVGDEAATAAKADELIAQLRADHTPEELKAIAKKTTGKSGRTADEALKLIHTDLTAVARLRKTQQV